MFFYRVHCKNPVRRLNINMLRPTCSLILYKLLYCFVAMTRYSEYFLYYSKLPTNLSLKPQFTKAKETQRLYNTPTRRFDCQDWIKLSRNTNDELKAYDFFKMRHSSPFFVKVRLFRYPVPLISRKSQSHGHDFFKVNIKLFNKYCTNAVRS